MMERFFNTAGPCFEDRHYMLPPLRRLQKVDRLIKQGHYFVIHAPRQTGKTTALMAMARDLMAAGHYAALVVSGEAAQPYGSDIDAAEQALLSSWSTQSRIGLPLELRPDTNSSVAPGTRILDVLTRWAEACPRPIVLFFDEIDAVKDDTLISILRQLRMGYPSRPVAFPHTVVLVGLRDVRDYKAQIRAEIESMGTVSPFNIKSDSLPMRNFDEAEVGELYAQHTAETGQVFEPEAVARVFELTQGQPWLVNALARQLVEEDVPDPGQPITLEHVEAAKETLILRRDTHLDSLADKLREERVRRVIEPILAGTMMSMDSMNDDLIYVRDLGLVVDRPNIRIANPIYREVIPRTLTYLMQVSIAQEAAWYERPDGTLDMHTLLRAFQKFFRRNSEIWLERFDYKEAGPHLILMAFLQRVVNGGGTVERELASGSGRADLVVTWKGRRYVLELKLYYDAGTVEEGLEQLDGYLDRLGESEGWLVVFDRRPGRSWEEKIYEQALEAPSGRKIHLFGA